MLPVLLGKAELPNVQIAETQLQTETANTPCMSSLGLCKCRLQDTDGMGAAATSIPAS